MYHEEDGESSNEYDIDCMSVKRVFRIGGSSDGIMTGSQGPGV